MTSAQSRYDVVVVGGGHNGLVAAAYLARAGRSVLLLERRDRVGGATDRSPVVGVPDPVLADLGVDLRLDPAAPDPAVPEAWRDLARAVRPMLLEPLRLEREVRALADPDVWSELVTTPVGVAVERRSVDAAPALFGTSVSLHDPSLVQNRAYLHHLLHDWRVPLDGPHAVADALARAASDAGVEILTTAGVSRVAAGDDGAGGTGGAAGAEVTWHDGMRFHTVAARLVLAGVAPWVLRILLGEAEDPDTKPEGAQVTVTLDGDLPADLPTLLQLGTDLPALERAYADTEAGRLPDPLPGLLREVGTGWVFTGLHVPAHLTAQDPDAARRAVADRVLAGLGALLAHPVPPDRARVELAQDVERELALPGGHWFHGGPDWPWAPNRARLETPAQQWGVQTVVDSVLLCGSGTRRGGGVTGLGGHNAARAALAML